jgi:hypothetical protein
VVRVGNNQPKEAKKKKPDNTFLSNFVSVRDEDGQKEEENGGLNFLYPFGATLTIQSPAFGLLGSGPLCYPSNRPLFGAYAHQKGGRLAVMGSTDFFTDEFFEKEENQKVLVRGFLSC